jgi:hypothetical protein
MNWVARGDLTMPRIAERSPVASAVTLGGAGALAASSLLGWASLGVGQASASTDLTAVPLACVALGTAVLAIAGGGLAALAGRPGGLAFAALAGAVTAVVVCGYIAAAELAATATPDDPVSALAVGLDPTAGAGAWVALGAALSVVIAAARPIRMRALAAARRAREQSPALAGALGMLVLALVALVQLRLDTWLGGTARGLTLTVTAGALPLVSTMTFAALMVLAAGIALICVGRTELGALTAAVAGWVANAAAALTIVAGQTLAGLHVHAVHVSLAVWLTFAVGLVTAGAAAVVLDRGGARR